MIAATMVYLPGLTIYRENWLRNRLSAAYTAAPCWKRRRARCRRRCHASCWTASARG
ncbi:protein of unknown function [Methylocella tundrae]|uniref:Uncharacterized protein n=1 Tax=Methylocella tundrae TaxID=227605 RepID=A0A4U8Z2I2_METTU|nr:protein of unknown function [Methylocella tundrae]